MPVTDKIVSAVGVEIFQDTANPYEAKQHYKHVVLVVDKNVLPMCELFFRTAAYLHILIPSQAGKLVTDEAYKKAVEFGAYNRGLIHGVVVASDLSGIDSDSVEAIIIDTENPQIMESYLNHAARIAKECARVAVVTTQILDEKYFGDRAIAGLKKVEDFYCGTVRKTRSKVANPRRRPSRSRRKPVKREEPVDLANIPRIKVRHRK